MKMTFGVFKDHKTMGYLTPFFFAYIFPLHACAPVVVAVMCSCYCCRDAAQLATSIAFPLFPTYFSTLPEALSVHMLHLLTFTWHLVVDGGR